ncbi:MAG TPA: hypothetical protein VJT54_13300 [Verrucomicrobiae bacterium]|nr:hypothetical protein [Verrucomicrobiae bacterium]
MKRRLVLRRVAEKEFDNSIAWYESRGEGLGREFRAAIEQYLERIADNPERFPKIRGEHKDDFALAKRVLSRKEREDN